MTERKECLLYIHLSCLILSKWWKLKFISSYEKISHAIVTVIVAKLMQLYTMPFLRFPWIIQKIYHIKTLKDDIFHAQFWTYLQIGNICIYNVLEGTSLVFCLSTIKKKHELVRHSVSLMCVTMTHNLWWYKTPADNGQKSNTAYSFL